MRINRYTDYAYRVLMYLAVNNSERATMAGIASYYGISHEHLRKVVHQLSTLGYINTYIGKGGGMELKKAPAKINLGKVFMEFEGINPLIDCYGANCPLRASCDLNHVFAKAQRAFLDEVKQHTLADLLQNTRMAKTLMNP
tara:strand:- start:182 stop:604 length:423 start_codon:yes stop_codon:yes gene_type:complete